MAKVKEKAPRTVAQIQEEQVKLHKELEASLKHYHKMTIQDYEKLRIPSRLLRHFHGRTHYTDSMEKLVWEEDD